MRLFFCLLLAACSWAEVTAGVSVRVSTFDPATTPRGSVIPGKTKAPVHRSLLTPEQQAAQEAFVKPRGPERVPSPPRLESTGTLPSRTPALAGSPLADTAGISFEGIPQTELLPPSPSIAVGPDDVIEVVNSRIARFSRDGKMTDSVHLQQWFQTDLPSLCPSASQGACILGDVSVRYDQYHGRFVMILQARDEMADNSFILVSVSNGATYASGWKNWVLDAIDVNGSVRSYADFPQIGLDDQAIYITMVRFRSFFNSLLTPKLRILRKADLYKPGATALPYKDLTGFTNADNSQVLTLQPVHMRGRTGVAAPGALMINASGVAGADYLTLWRINDPLGNPSTVRTTLSGLWKYGAPAPAAQLGTNTLLFTGTDPDILKAVYREGVLAAAQNAGFADEPTTVAYTRIGAASNSVLSQSRWINGNFFFPAFDVPATTGPAVSLPNKLITGTTTGAGGNLTYAGITDVKAGEDVYRPSGDGQARYGEYFGGAVDPVNGGLWVTGEYAKPRLSGVSQYGTWVAYFPWGTTPLYSDVSTASLFFDSVNVLGMWGITGGCGVSIFCPGGQTTRGQMAAFIVRSIFGEKFTPPATPYFTDVPATHPQFAYIQKLRELGITQGCTAARFCPDDTVTRSQAAVFVIRAKFGALFGDNFSFPSTAYFSDVATGDPRFPFVQKLRELGITQGCAAGRFCPEDPVTREQMAAFLVRAFLN